MGALGTGSRMLHVLILGTWFGACVLFAGVVAPAAFEVIPSRDVAGNLVTATLQAIDVFGLVAGPVLIVTLLLGWLPLGTPLKLRFFGSVAMTAAVATSGRWLTPQMLNLRYVMQRPIEELAGNDPARLEFGRLHEISTALFGAHAVLALVLLVLALAGTTPKRKSSIEL